MDATVSVENTCKFCGWKAERKDGKKTNPLFIMTKGGEITAFCPMCNYELNISYTKYVDDDKAQ